jgi:RNA polymerase sigma factor (sigma-70 family)
MDRDTHIGGPSSRFPDTRQSAVRGIRSECAEVRAISWDAIIAAYWKPVYKYVRVRWHEPNEEAKDLVQAFFTRAIEREAFAAFDAQRGAFRTYLRAALDNFLSNEKRDASRLKRCGTGPLLSLDFESAEGELRRHEPLAAKSVEDYFRQEWARSLFELALDRLRVECGQRGKLTPLRIFQRYDLCDAEARPTYQELADAFGITSATVTNYLAAMRRDFRRAVLDQLRELTADEREFRNEARAVLGIEAR